MSTTLELAAGAAALLVLAGFLLYAPPSRREGEMPRAALSQADADVARSLPVAPGTYSLVLTSSGANLATARGVVIVAGQETALELEADTRPR